MLVKILIGIGMIILTLILTIVLLQAVEWIEDKFNGILWEKRRCEVYWKRKKENNGRKVSTPRKEGGDFRKIK